MDFTFDMRETGKRISDCRKQKNMTQLEIADKLNISFQAVSSWERGETMPDISRLPELAQILGVSVDDILPNHKQAQIIEKINGGNISDISKNDDISFADIVQTAPLLKPSQLNELFNNKDYDLNNIAALSSIAPFVSKEVLDKLAEKEVERNGIGELSRIAPFVSVEILDKFAEMEVERNGIGELSSIAPFVSKEVLDKLTEKEVEKNGIGELSRIAPFVSVEILDKLAEKEVERNGIGELSSIAPFVSKEVLDKLAEKEVEKNGIGELSRIAPFVSKEVLDKLAEKVK